MKIRKQREAVVMIRGILVGLLVAFLLCNGLYFSSAQTSYINGTYIDLEIIEILKSGKIARVSVALEDQGSKELNLDFQDSFIDSFSEEELIGVEWRSSRGRGFVGNITQKGFDKLLESPEVLSIFLPVSGSTALPFPYIDPAIYSEFNNSEWISLIINLNNYSEVDSVLSNFTEDELRNVVKRSISENFIAEMNEDGFNKLKNDQRIESVFFNAPASIIQQPDEINEWDIKRDYPIVLIIIVSILIVLVSIYFAFIRRRLK